MARDPRADILEDDLFPRPTRKIHRVHANPSPSITVKQWMGAINPKEPVLLHNGNIWHFSKEEKHHLLLATAAFTIALGIAMATDIGGIFSIDITNDLGITVAMFLISMPVMLIAVGPAFILHEIGHKIVAKKYGCWAEFRADPNGLKFGIMFVVLTGLVIMAPGAVMVAGLVTRRQNGHIAIAGPLVNFTLFGIGIVFGGLILGVTGAEEYANFELAFISNGAINLKAIVGGIVYFWIFANLGLGLFNMIPYGPLDGAKIKDWNELVWFGTFITFIIIAFLWNTQVFNPINDITIKIAEMI